MSLIPAMMSPPAPIYALLAFALGVSQLFLAVRFLLLRDGISAKWLLRASLIYLPVVMIGLATIPLLS